MPVIVVANTKGGTGKSTSSLILGTVLAAGGASVKLIDTDHQQQTLGKWANGSKSRFADLVICVEDTKTLVGTIDAEAKRNQFVIVDVQGRASLTMARALSRAHFVILPLQAKQTDADGAAQALALIQEEEESLQRSIPHKVLITRSNAGIATKEEKDIIKFLNEANVPKMKTSLNERTAFSRLHSYKLSLDELDPKEVNGIPGAIQNASEFAAEVIETVLEVSQK